MGKSPFLKYLSLTLALFFLLPQAVFALPAQETARDIVIYKKDGVSVSDLKTKGTSLGRNVAVVHGTELQKVKAKKAKGEIEAWGFREKYSASVVPNDTYYGNQWAMPKIEAPAAWDVTAGSSEVVIAVLDTGFLLTHPDLSAKFVSGYDYVSNDNDPSLPSGGGDRYYHGTLVAGAAAASTNNAAGVAGMDWNAKIMPLRVMDNNGSGFTDDIADGIDYARLNGADVINLSLGYHPDPGVDPDPVLRAAVNNAYNAGVTVVAASGNENREVSYPAAFDNVIAVGATDEGDVRCDPGILSDCGYGSNYGSELDVVAPGNNIYTTTTTWNGSSYVSGYTYISGTSLATPIVAGLVGLLESRQDYTPVENKNFLINATEKVSGMSGANFTEYYGYGRINASRTVGRISLNSFRITMEDTDTPLDDSDYVLADYPAVGEPVAVRAVLKNENASSFELTNVRIKGTLSSGTQFIVGTIPSLTLAAATTTAVPVQTFNISSFYTHTFSIDYELDSIVKIPYVKPTYSYQQIKAHYPNIKVVKTPVFAPALVASYETVKGVYKLKNYDARPAYIRSTKIWAKLDKNLYHFSLEAPKIDPGDVFYYERQTIPYKKGNYLTYVEVTYGNGKSTVPTSLLSVSSYGAFEVY